MIEIEAVKTSAAALFFFAVFTAAGCGADRDPDEACRAVCDRDAECGKTEDADECAALCSDLAKNSDSYGAAMVTRADCYDQDLACDELVTCDQ